MANRSEMVATWRKKYRRAKIQDEKSVMKRASERAGNFASYKKKKRSILHASLVSLDKISLPSRGKWPVRIKTNKIYIEHLAYNLVGEGNGNPLQCSCLENPRDRGAWWAAIYGVV